MFTDALNNFLEIATTILKLMSLFLPEVRRRDILTDMMQLLICLEVLCRINWLISLRRYITALQVTAHATWNNAGGLQPCSMCNKGFCH